MSFTEGKQKLELMMNLKESSNKLQEVLSNISDLQDLIMAYEIKQEGPFFKPEMALRPARIVQNYNRIASSLSHEMDELCGIIDGRFGKTGIDERERGAEVTFRNRISKINADSGNNLFADKKYRRIFEDFVLAKLDERSWGSLKELAPGDLLFKDKNITPEKTDQIIQTVKKDIILVIKPLTERTRNVLVAALKNQKTPKTSVKDMFKKQQHFDISR